ncbi:aldo/keto reductase [Mycena metata]|uniref:Aldo/keto reductase n=1 Tax=Mycena metata TaxID=1033252 RepID=A0AAD7MG77_9AGAR|nr:aldo/keto reductase [Mycena metata]
MGSPGPGSRRVYQMCLEALKCGYRHLDTAAGYENEVEVGRAIRDSVKEAFEELLKKLDVDYIDALAPSGAHSPVFCKVLGAEEHPTPIETWKAMEQLLQTGKVKTIGVSNFSTKTLEYLLLHCEIIPAINQVEMHPCLPQADLKAYCEAKNILLTAYSPLGTFFTEDATVQGLAQKLNASPAQIVISWASENKERMRTNMTLVSLSAEDMKVLDTLHRQTGMHKSLFPYHNESLRVFGWTYEQLG